MQIQRTLPDGKTVFVMEASSPKQAFERLAFVDELFSETECGCCHSKDIKFAKRPVDNGFYLEMRCNKCTAQLSYGQMKEGGGIFVKKWDKENRRPMPNGGWFVYQNKNSDSHHHNQDAEPPPSRGRKEEPKEQPHSDDDVPF